jgi:hypothetical protein
MERIEDYVGRETVFEPHDGVVDTASVGREVYFQVFDKGVRATIVGYNLVSKRYFVRIEEVVSGIAQE